MGRDETGAPMKVRCTEKERDRVSSLLLVALYGRFRAAPRPDFSPLLHMLGLVHAPRGCDGELRLVTEDPVEGVELNPLVLTSVLGKVSEDLTYRWGAVRRRLAGLLSHCLIGLLLLGDVSVAGNLRAYQNTRPFKRQQVLVIGEGRNQSGPSVAHVGSNFGASAAAPSGRFAVAALDRSTGTLELKSLGGSQVRRWPSLCRTLSRLGGAGGP
eukprot:scaffold6405_cov390-Prasinococcus_capsulatus_cf.AAC.6